MASRPTSKNIRKVQAGLFEDGQRPTRPGATGRPSPFILDVGEPDPMAGAAAGGMEQFADPKTMADMVGLNIGQYNGGPADVDDGDFYRNLASDIEKDNPSALSTMAQELVDSFDRDLATYDQLDALTAKGIQEMGFDRTSDTRSDPFPGASAIHHPMMAQVIVEFASRAMNELMPPAGPAKLKVLGKQTDEKTAKAQRAAGFLNWQLTEQCPEYRSEYEKMLMILGLTGDCVRKLYWDSDNNRPRSEFINSDQFVVPYATTDLETCPRYTHVMYHWPDTVKGYQASKLWRDVVLPMPSTFDFARSKTKEKSDNVTQQQPSADDRDSQYTFLEMHVDWYFDYLGKDQGGGDPAAAAAAPALTAQTDEMDSEEPPAEDNIALADIQALTSESAPEAEAMVELSGADTESDDQVTTGSGDTPGGERRKRPYIVTIEKVSKTVVAVRRNWKRDDPKARKRVWFMHYVLFPWTGWRGIGLWHMIGAMARGATAALRALLDAAMIKTMPSGIRLKGSRTSGTSLRFKPLEIVEVDAPGATDIRQVAMALPFNGPDTVLFELLGFLVQSGSRFASVALQQIAEANPNMPVGTTLALVEEGGRVYNAIHSRLHFAQKKELALLAELDFENLDDQTTVQAFGGELVVSKDDFAGNVGIAPVSDPAVSNHLQRMARGDALLALALKAKDSGLDANLKLAFKQAAKNIGSEDIDELFPEAKKATPLDPVSELMAMVKGEPVDAFPGQNHEAHVAFLRNVAKNPQYMGMIQNIGPRFVAIGQAHLVMAIKDRFQGAMQLGPEQEQQVQQNPEAQKQIAAAMAQLSAKLPTTDMFGTTSEDGGGMMTTMMLNETAREEIAAEREKALIKAGTERDIAEARLVANREEKMWELMVKLVIDFSKSESQDEKNAATMANNVSMKAKDMMMEVIKLMNESDRQREPKAPASPYRQAAE